MSTKENKTSLLSYLHTHLQRIEYCLVIASGATVFFMVLLSVAQVLSRNLFNLPIFGFIDWVEQSMAVFAFCGLAYCQLNNKHIRMNLIVNRFKERLFWIVELFNATLSLLLFSALIIGSYFHFLRAYTLGDSTIDISLPNWPSKLLVTVMLCMMSARLLLQVCDMFSLALGWRKTPITIYNNRKTEIETELDDIKEIENTQDIKS